MKSIFKLILLCSIWPNVCLCPCVCEAWWIETKDVIPSTWARRPFVGIKLLNVHFVAFLPFWPFVSACCPAVEHDCRCFFYCALYSLALWPSTYVIHIVAKQNEKLPNVFFSASLLQMVRPNETRRFDGSLNIWFDNGFLFDRFIKNVHIAGSHWNKPQTNLFQLAYFSIKIAFTFASQQDLLAASVCNSVQPFHSRRRHTNWVKSFNKITNRTRNQQKKFTQLTTNKSIFFPAVNRAILIRPFFVCKLHSNALFVGRRKKRELIKRRGSEKSSAQSWNVKEAP